ncbi:DUF3298 and DUF4163 domain-containing protein [Listeria sp. ILCC797]|uniref:DUF3298 and DUF4163 domain-containing protein n=1 Tax=Listeria sp. ILCC797 TaxID=1918333 RepID=UPI000B587281|nr:DUF3298 and DUF4163 domain-containing protein [Listeria sp. ILCC797]
MTNKNFQKLRRAYKNIPIPSELNERVNHVLQTQPKKKKHFLAWSACSAVVVCLMFFVVVMTNSTVANAMRNVPILNQVIAVVTGNQFKDKTEKNEASIETPEIKGLSNDAFAKQINNAYIQTSEELYQEYKEYVSKKGEHYSVTSYYDTLVNTKQLLVVRFTVEKTMASSYVQNEYITLDKEKQKLVRLDDLFKDDDYTVILQEYIKAQMKAEMSADDSDKIYWDENELEPILTKEYFENHFYIDQNRKLVITFDEYDVAPGYMGPISFVIPTEAIQAELTNTNYIY